jgi:hypothetical protein
MALAGRRANGTVASDIELGIPLAGGILSSFNSIYQVLLLLVEHTRKIETIL